MKPKIYENQKTVVETRSLLFEKVFGAFSEFGGLLA